MAKKQVVLGVDLGTQRLKLILLDVQAGRIIGEASERVRTRSPEPGAMEQDPEEWWQICSTLIRDLISSEGICPQQVLGIGLSGEMHSLLLLDEGGNPIHPVVLWNDSRAARWREHLEGTGHMLWNPSGAAYTALKLLWLKERNPEAFDKARVMIFPKDYLRYKMTGSIGTDPSDASGSLLWNFAKGTWDGELVARLGLASIQLPAPDGSCSVAGRLTAEASRTTGLLEGTPVAAGLGDVAAAVIGAGAATPNTVFINTGTAAQVIRVHDVSRHDMRPGGNRSAYLFELGLDNLMFTMGALPSAGFSLEWWRRVLGDAVTYKEIDRLAGTVEPGCGGCVFLPYLQGTGTPYLVDGPLGSFLQLSGFTGQAQLNRAVMEGVAFAIRQCGEVVGRVGSDRVLITGGITQSQVWTQILADVLGTSLQIRELKDASCVGAAAIAAKALGITEDTNSLVSQIAGKITIKQPDPRAAASYADVFPHYARWAERIALAD